MWLWLARGRHGPESHVNGSWQDTDGDSVPSDHVLSLIPRNHSDYILERKASRMVWAVSHRPLVRE